MAIPLRLLPEDLVWMHTGHFQTRLHLASLTRLASQQGLLSRVNYHLCPFLTMDLASAEPCNMPIRMLLFGRPLQVKEVHRVTKVIPAIVERLVDLFIIFMM